MAVIFLMYVMLPYTENMFFSPIIANAELDLVEYLTYIKHDDHIQITNCDNSVFGDIIIPNEIEGLPVTKIGGEIGNGWEYSAFSGVTYITSVTIPESVTEIGSGAFYGCSRLKSIIIPSSTLRIGNNAFAFCSELTDIELSNGIEFIGDYAFYRCDKLSLIVLPNSIIEIGEQSFANCKNLESIIVSKNNENYCDIDGVLFTYDKAIILQYPNGRVNEAYTIPESVKRIGESAFSMNENLKSVVIPDSVTVIGDSAFYRNINLKSITIGSRVSSIGRAAFWSCSKIETVNLPDSLRRIEDGAFIYCYNLANITFSDSIGFIGSSAFSETLWLNEQLKKSSLIIINGMLIAANPNSDKIIIPKIVNRITGCAFTDCSVSELVIEGDCTIERYAFSRSKIDKLIIKGEIICLEDLQEEVGYVEQNRKNNYVYTDSNDLNEFLLANCNSIYHKDIDSSTYSNSTYYNNGFWNVDGLQEVAATDGTIYAVYGYYDSIMLISPSKEQEIVTIEMNEFTFGGATIDENDKLYVLWGYSISEADIEDAIENDEENLVVVCYDLNGNIISKCGVSINITSAQYPFSAGNANLCVNNGILGCLYNTEWIKSSDGDNHQGSEFFAVNTSEMKLIDCSTYEGSHSFGVTMIPTEYGFAAIQMGMQNHKEE